MEERKRRWDKVHGGLCTLLKDLSALGLCLVLLMFYYEYLDFGPLTAQFVRYLVLWQNGASEPMSAKDSFDIGYSICVWPWGTQNELHILFLLIVVPLVTISAIRVLAGIYRSPGNLKVDFARVGAALAFATVLSGPEILLGRASVAIKAALGLLLVIACFLVFTALKSRSTAILSGKGGCV